jgi:single-stranded DNA-binding protein
VANLVILSGVAQAPRLHYRDDGRPVCTFLLAVQNKNRKSGKTFEQLIAVEVWGTEAEEVAATLEAGQTVLVQGTLGFRSVDKVKQPAIICWGVEVLSPAPARAVASAN